MVLKEAFAAKTRAISALVFWRETKDLEREADGVR